MGLFASRTGKPLHYRPARNTGYSPLLPSGLGPNHLPTFFFNLPPPFCLGRLLDLGLTSFIHRSSRNRLLFHVCATNFILSIDHVPSRMLSSWCAAKKKKDEAVALGGISVL